MAAQFFSIFVNVIVPVFVLVLMGYSLGPRLNIDYRSLTRTAYYILIPAFVFNVLSTLQIDINTAGRMILGISLVYIGSGLISWLVAHLLRLSREMTVAFFMTSVFGNVGNFGLALTGFKLGQPGMQSATVYMMTINTLSFALCVLAAGWVRNGGMGAIKTLFKTPGVIILPFALVFPLTGTTPPLMVRHISGLLSDAMIPIMLLVLGLQLRESGKLEWGIPTFAASGIRLIIGPILAFLLIPFLGLSGIQASSGILQASMPAAVLTAIIALENDIVPAFVTSVVFTTTLLSLISLAIVMLFI